MIELPEIYVRTVAIGLFVFHQPVAALATKVNQIMRLQIRLWKEYANEERLTIYMVRTFSQIVMFFSKLARVAGNTFSTIVYQRSSNYNALNNGFYEVSTNVLKMVEFSFFIHELNIHL